MRGTLRRYLFSRTRVHACPSTRWWTVLIGILPVSRLHVVRLFLRLWRSLPLIEIECDSRGNGVTCTQGSGSSGYILRWSCGSCIPQFSIPVEASVCAARERGGIISISSVKRIRINEKTELGSVYLRVGTTFACLSALVVVHFSWHEKVEMRAQEIYACAEMDFIADGAK